MQSVPTLAEVIAGLLKRGHRLASEHTPTDTPILAGRRLPNGSGQQFDFELSVAKYDKTVKLTFNVDRFGEWEGDEFSLWFGPGHIECGVVVTVPSPKGEIRFGVVLIGDGTPLNRLPGFASWEQFANRAVPLLSMFPQLGVPVLPSRTAALTAFVFRSVYGTEYVDETPPYAMVEDLWQATLFALSLIDTKQTTAVPPQSEASSAELPSRVKSQGKRGNPGISEEEAALRREILASWNRDEWPQRAAADKLFPRFRDRLRTVLPKSGKRRRTVENADDFYDYLTACLNWNRTPSQKRRRSEKTTRKNSPRRRKDSSE